MLGKQDIHPNQREWRVVRQLTAQQALEMVMRVCPLTTKVGDQKYDTLAQAVLAVQQKRQVKWIRRMFIVVQENPTQAVMHSDYMWFLLGRLIKKWRRRR